MSGLMESRLTRLTKGLSIVSPSIQFVSAGAIQRNSSELYLSDWTHYLVEVLFCVVHSTTVLANRESHSLPMSDITW